MPKQSDQDTGGTVWNDAGLRLGSAGIDLRRPSEPPALSDLLNARFLDERTLERRAGFTGVETRDGDAFPTGALAPTAANWIYGHGHEVGAYYPLGYSPGVGGPASIAPNGPNVHYPIYLRGAATFHLADEHVVWTGDRLLMPQGPGQPCLGTSPFWQRLADIQAGDAATKQYPRGIPAHLPLATDTPAPSTLTGDDVEGCLTPTLRVFVTVKANRVLATTVDRATGTVIDTTDVTGSSVAPCEPTVISSGGTPVLLWRDSDASGRRLYIRRRTGNGWTLEDYIAQQVDAYDVALTPDGSGFWVLWRIGGTLRVGQYTGTVTESLQLPFASVLTTAQTPDGPVALSLDGGNNLGVLYTWSTTLTFELYLAQQSTSTLQSTVRQSVTTWRGLALVPRYLSDSAGNFEWVVYSGESGGAVQITTLSRTYPAAVSTVTRYNCDLVSRAFAVGDEAFIYLRSRNSATVFLLCGASHPYVSGFSDPDVGLLPRVPAGGDLFGYWPHRVLPDPTSATVTTWTRKYNTNDAAREGNVVSGDSDFLPRLSYAVYGKSGYLSGSCVKNWDGQVLADAGFHDYPVIAVATLTAGGGLTALGTYEYRIYAVRYNNQGERFESPAVTHTFVPLPSGDQSAVLSISTVPGVSTDDIIFEIYRTESLGTTFRLEGTVANDLTVAAVSFTSTMPDATLRSQVGDPHATGTGNAAIVESTAPLGCAILATIGDRLWGAGGQVGAGIVQFSTLKSAGQGAGFDELAGYIQVDNEGGEVTSVAGLNDGVVIFERDRLFVLAGTGPDNFGNGSYSAPELVLAAGAVTHFGTALTQLGVLYWGSGGPLLLSMGYKVENVSSPVRPLTETLTPTGVQVDTARMEAVWFCGTQAVLLNYMGDGPRWARWTLPPIAACSDVRAITTDGRLLTEGGTVGDDGVPYPFLWRTGNLRAGELLEGGSLIRRVGLAGAFLGAHTLRFHHYYDGSPLWTDEVTWAPEVTSWLTLGTDVSTLTPAQIDALAIHDRSGAYATDVRLRRTTCHYVAIEVSDISSWTPTYVPFELSLEIGALPGLGRTPVSTFTRS